MKAWSLFKTSDTYLDGSFSSKAKSTCNDKCKSCPGKQNDHPAPDILLGSKGNFQDRNIAPFFHWNWVVWVAYTAPADGSGTRGRVIVRRSVRAIRRITGKLPDPCQTSLVLYGRVS